MARLLIQHGASLRATDGKGATPLYAACANGQTDVARLLLLAGADMTEPRESNIRHGVTPFYAACMHGNVRVVELMLDRGASITQPSARWSGGATPIFAACTELGPRIGGGGAETSLVEFHQNARTRTGCALTTAEHGIRLYTRPSFLESESSSDRKLWGTGTEGHAEVAKLLLDRGADAAQPTNDGSTPLLSAISRGHADIVALLLKFGADVSHPTKDGRIPLVSACLHGRLPVVALLLEHGADASLPNRDRLGLRTRHGPSCFQTRIAHGDTDPRFPKH